MLTRKLLVAALFFQSLWNIGFCQIKNIGLPYIKNYSRDAYQAGSQNWSMVQDKNGFLYFANNSGILQFDGNTWQLYRTANESVVRSVAIGSDERIYAGAYNEIGYLQRKANGGLEYKSLTSLIPASRQNFGEVWKIYQTQFGIVFQSFPYVFILKDNKIEVLKPLSSFSFSYYVQGKYYLVDREHGILLYQNGTLTNVVNSPVFTNTEVRFILPYKSNQLLIGTINKGIFTFDGQKLTSWKTNVNQLLIMNQLFSGIALNNGCFAFGSIQDGVFISDSEGILLQHIDRVKSLQNNTILSLFMDHSNNLWLGLDNGISYAEISTPITFFNYCYGIETGYTSIVYRNILYLGTNQGLFAKSLDQLDNKDISDTRFRLVSGTEGQVWSLNVIDNQLLCGHNNGTYVINGFAAEQLSNIRGGWTFLQPAEDKSKVICGTYEGLILFGKSPGQQNLRFIKRIKGFSESCKTIFEDADGALWISHGYKGIYRIELTPGFDSVRSVRLFTHKDGLPEKLPYNLTKLDNTVLITTDNGVFSYDKSTSEVVKILKYNQFFQAHTSLRQVIPDSKGNIWYFSDANMGVYRLLEDGSYKDVYIPFLKISGKLVQAFEHLYAFDSKNIFIATQSGFVHYDPAISKNYYQPYSTYIRKVRLLKQSADSTYAFSGNKGFDDNMIRKNFTVPHKYNSISFSFSAPFYEDPEQTQFRYRLVGFDDTWSSWDSRTIKEFTNLREGHYTFEVQAINLYKNISLTDSFSFYVAPPFYRSKLAYTIYFMLMFSIFMGNLIYFRKRIENTRQKEKLRHQKRMDAIQQAHREESLLAEKKIEHLKNEKLTNEIKHKNKELANSTMHLIQKNKFLNSVKNEINNLLDSNIDNAHKNSLKRLLRHIDRDINNEKYLKVFDDYFDEVHQDFLTRLKEQYPDLSPKELRLCAYLKMNLSSKEIAVLMNISIRGVEVSRYRLRKKLGIERDTNLIDYILKF